MSGFDRGVGGGGQRRLRARIGVETRAVGGAKTHVNGNSSEIRLYAYQ